ncbi:hypothetical protein, conserved in T. vivax [Trypanosoma vivax Y486]|uniref:Transmembrane protein n=1 Tax=Trypanosoma vivax (strain Y486) TaxID=1055687 RepID=F9WLZ0_TRYVY|nr:hypothetical protein, conserved in T. vivax [Trypanosoma vivax Y486]|eukprot:CCD18536.1 hypothetical protein, conserved in T. vivax [Trypanosoma vivax Y486]
MLFPLLRPFRAMSVVPFASLSFLLFLLCSSSCLVVPFIVRARAVFALSCVFRVHRHFARISDRACTLPACRRFSFSSSSSSSSCRPLPLPLFPSLSPFRLFAFSAYALCAVLFCAFSVFLFLCRCACFGTARCPSVFYPLFPLAFRHAFISFAPCVPSLSPVALRFCVLLPGPFLRVRPFLACPFVGRVHSSFSFLSPLVLFSVAGVVARRVPSRDVLCCFLSPICCVFLAVGTSMRVTFALLFAFFPYCCRPRSLVAERSCTQSKTTLLACPFWPMRCRCFTLLLAVRRQTSVPPILSAYCVPSWRVALMLLPVLLLLCLPLFFRLAPTRLAVCPSLVGSRSCGCCPSCLWISRGWRAWLPRPLFLSFRRAICV